MRTGWFAVIGLLSMLTGCSSGPPAGHFVCVGMEDSAGALDCNDVCAAQGTTCIDFSAGGAPADHGCDWANLGVPFPGTVVSAMFFDNEVCTLTDGARGGAGECGDSLFARRSDAAGTFDPLTVGCCCAQ